MAIAKVLFDKYIIQVSVRQRSLRYIANASSNMQSKHFRSCFVITSLLGPLGTTVLQKSMVALEVCLLQMHVNGSMLVQAAGCTLGARKWR
ncbi:hypothetical protein HPP92_001951 [Vanilla planifolia]|uniref:Uncharacterized protein n=1 Tax=Vanilla planifolia TaxID=51239 RepID=A0A835VHJ2_VANPL|nr:hypothetical protein HPP92_001951 [Vanilla planifolia]